MVLNSKPNTETGRPFAHTTYKLLFKQRWDFCTLWPKPVTLSLVVPILSFSFQQSFTTALQSVPPSSSLFKRHKDMKSWPGSSEDHPPVTTGLLCHWACDGARVAKERRSLKVAGRGHMAALQATWRHKGIRQWQFDSLCGFGNSMAGAQCDYRLSTAHGLSLGFLCTVAPDSQTSVATQHAPMNKTQHVWPFVGSPSSLPFFCVSWLKSHRCLNCSVTSQLQVFSTVLEALNVPRHRQKCLGCCLKHKKKVALDLSQNS
jgi:hypothetical protein